MVNTLEIDSNFYFSKDWEDFFKGVNPTIFDETLRCIHNDMGGNLLSEDEIHGLGDKLVECTLNDSQRDFISQIGTNKNYMKRLMVVWKKASKSDIIDCEYLLTSSMDDLKKGHDFMKSISSVGGFRSMILEVQERIQSSIK